MFSSDPKSFYSQQGLFSTPGPYANLYENLPCDIDTLCNMVNGLIVHDLWVGMGQLEISEDRKKEAEIRAVQVKLKHIKKLDARPLSQARPFKERLLGNCRDQALLLCSFLRHSGIPSRVRMGFMMNSAPRNLDHAICQVWSESDYRWQTVDVQMDNMIRESGRLPSEVRQYLTTITPQNTPPENFITGGQAWLKCRSGESDPMSFGIYGDLWGLWMIRHNLLRDLLALNKYELIPWDEIPNSLINKDRSEPTPEQLVFLDHVAEVTINADSEFNEIQRLYIENPRLHIPAEWVQSK